MQTACKIAQSEEPLRATIAALEGDLRAERNAVLAEKQVRTHEAAAFRQQIHALEASVQELKTETAEARAEASRHALR